MKRIALILALLPSLAFAQGILAAVEAVTAQQLDEPKLRRIIRAEFEATDDYQLGFQPAVQVVMQETGLDCYIYGRIQMTATNEGFPNAPAAEPSQRPYHASQKEPPLQGRGGDTDVLKAGCVVDTLVKPGLAH